MYMIHTHVHACMGLQWTPDNTSLWAVKFRFIKQFMYTLPPDKPSYRLHIVYPHFLAPSVLGFQMAVLRKVCLLTGGPTLTGVSCVRFDFCSKAKLFSCLFSPHWCIGGLEKSYIQQQHGTEALRFSLLHPFHPPSMPCHIGTTKLPLVLDTHTRLSFFLSWSGKERKKERPEKSEKEFKVGDRKLRTKKKKSARSSLWEEGKKSRRRRPPSPFKAPKSSQLRRRNT